MRTSIRIVRGGAKALTSPNVFCRNSRLSTNIYSMSMSTSTTSAQATPTTIKAKPLLPVHVRYSTSPEWIPGATSTLTSAFKGDPVTAWILQHLPPAARPSALQDLFTLSSHAALLSGGELWSAETLPDSSQEPSTIPDFQATATIFPPSTSLDNLGAASIPSLMLSGGLTRALWSIGPSALRARMDAYSAAITPAKKSVFGTDESYFYVQLIGASAAHRGKGLAPALITKLQERAGKEGKAVWLEASNKAARRVYEKLGFEDVETEIVLGKGECNEAGEKAQGEEATGVPMWAMIWRPQKRS